MSTTENDAMDVDTNEKEVIEEKEPSVAEEAPVEEEDEEEELDEFNDNLDSSLPGTKSNIAETSRSASMQPLIPELPELTRKDKSLREILSMMDDYSPVIPDAVTDYLMAKNGLQINDLNIKRLLLLATQKFISDIAQDAYEYSRIRSNTVNKLKNTLNNNQLNPPSQQQSQLGRSLGANASNAATAGTSGNSANPNNEKLTLTVEDLSSALEEHGVNIKRPSFYR